MDVDTQKLLLIFRTEIGEVLDELLQTIETFHLMRGTELQEVVANALRLAHNVKGGAAVVDIEEIVTLAHALEEILGPFRSSEQPPPQPAIELMAENVILMQRLVDEEGGPEEISDLLRRLADCSGRPPAATKATASKAAATASEPRPVTPVADDIAGPVAAEPRRQGPLAMAPTGSVRISTERLDRLMAHIGELLVTHARMAVRTERIEAFQEEFLANLSSLPVDGQENWRALLRQLEAIVRDDRHELLGFGHLTGALGAAMKAVRMVPLANSGSAWQRTIRQNAASLDKKVRLEIAVGAIELDRLVLERLREAMVHLLRNAVDHGIESAQERQEKGKSKRATIRIQAAMHGAMVHLEISDDGQGIDLEKIVETARQRGIWSKGESEGASDEEILGVLFAPGFSSAASVSQVSGRGVGLEVVRRAVLELGGSIAVVPHGTLGGATFVLTLPISLLSSRGLLVRAGGYTYALPIEYIEHTLRVDAAALQQVDRTQAIKLGEDAEPIRVRWLSSLMGVERSADPPMLKVVVIADRGSRLGLVVDEVLQEEEYVTKQLPWNLQRVGSVNGAVILPDGSLAVAVDLVQLFDVAGDDLYQRPSDPIAATARPCILVADDSLISRTLEYNTLAAAGYEVVLAVDGVEAWQTLNERKFDLLVSDVQMPGMDGTELTRRVRSDSHLKDLPVILVTGLGAEEDIAQGAAAGADEYVVKGELEQEKLLEAVARLL